MIKQKVAITIAQNLNKIDFRQILSKNDKTLCITATRSMSFFARENSNCNIIDFTELQQRLNEIAKETDCLKEQELKYILFQTINQIPDDELCKLAFKNSINEINGFFGKLLMSGITASDIDTDKIKQQYRGATKALFELYKKFLKNVKSKNKPTFYEERNRAIDEIVKGFDTVILFGFAFFNDLQNVMFRNLIRANKKVNFIINNDEFLLTDWLLPLLKQERVDYQIESVDNMDDDGIFAELRNGIFDSSSRCQKLGDRIAIVEPFATREMEFEYIAKEIVKALKGSKTREDVQMRCDDIAIVITSNFAKHAEMINKVFENIGVFIAPDGEIVFAEKKNAEEDVSGYVRLQVYQPNKMLFNSPVGKFVLEIYKVAGRGMSVASFNNLLSISRIFSDSVANDVISEFAIIKDFFDSITKVEEWIEQMQQLQRIKGKIANADDAYDGHPAKAIKAESLVYLNSYLNFISRIVAKVKSVKGTIKKHISTLIETIKEETKNEALEANLLNLFIDILRSSNDSIEYDNEYFSQNFIELISEHIKEISKKKDYIRLSAINLESINQYSTVFVPMFEINKYPTAYKYEFPYNKEIVEMLSSGEIIKGYTIPQNRIKDYNLKLSKYVFQNLFRIAKDKIVFTRIDHENGTPLDMSIFGYDIKNRCGIEHETKAKIKNSTQRNSEDGLIFKRSKITDLYLNELLEYQVCPKLFYYIVNHRDKMTYNDKFLLTFYARALIQNKTFKGLAEGKATYNSKTIKKATKDRFDRACEEVFENLPLFDDNAKRDIKLTSCKQVQNFLTNRIFSGKFAPQDDFTITLAKPKEITYKGVKVKTRNNIVLTDLKSGKTTEFDISRALDYLVSASGGTQTEKKHFDEIIEEMKNANKHFDRMHALNFLSFKVNTQLNVPKYSQDGEIRVQKLLDELGKHEYSNLGFHRSSFCSYCKLKNICMGVDDD